MNYQAWTDLKLTPAEIYRSMGNQAGEDYPALLPLLEKERKLALKLIRARSGYVILPVEISGKRQVTLDGRFPFTCQTRFFQGASHAVLLIATVGSALEQESTRCFQTGKYTEGLILDACGSAALDEILSMLRQEISRTTNGQGMTLGYTLSPGCQLIPLEEQATVFSLLDFEQLEVGLTDAFMMMPAKSISAVIPMGTTLKLPNDANYACEICSQQKTCRYKPVR